MKRGYRIRGRAVIALVLCCVFIFGASAYSIEDLRIPESATTLVYGTSGMGQSLNAYRFGDGNNILVVGFAIHGYEDNWAQDGLALVYTAGELMEMLEENQTLVDEKNWTVYVLPCMNPDGLLYGYTNNGPGRCTTTYIDAAGNLRTDTGIDLNRSFPHYYVNMTGGRNFNGSSPLSAYEARALAAFIQNVEGTGNNICIDTHGWMTQIITSNGYSPLYYAFKNQFPANTYNSLGGGQGYFAAYAADLGYTACLFEFPDGIYSMSQFISSGYSQKYCNAILTVLNAYGTERTDMVRITLNDTDGGTVSGGGSYTIGDPVELRAEAEEGMYFSGWYDANGMLISRENPYTFAAEENLILRPVFEPGYILNVVASRSGAVTGAGIYEGNTIVKLRADKVASWYNCNGVLLGTDTELEYTLLGNDTVYAVFGDDVFADIPADAWYVDEVMEAYDRGITKGISPVEFGAETDFNRAMAITVLYRMLGEKTEDTMVQASFADVEENSWYMDAVNWGYANGIVNGRSETEFAPMEPVTREEFLKMAIGAMNQFNPDEAKDPEEGEAQEETENQKEAEAEGQEESEDQEEGEAQEETENQKEAEGQEGSEGHEESELQGETENQEETEGQTDQEQSENIQITETEPGGDSAEKKEGQSLPEIVEDEARLPFLDMDLISEWALPFIRDAYACGIFKGDDQGLARPQSTLKRSEGAAIAVRIVHYLAG